MKLEKVHIANFRCIKDSGLVDIEDAMTVLIGKNEIRPPPALGIQNPQAPENLFYV